MPTPQTFFEYHEAIEQLKEERAVVWRGLLPDHVNDHASDDAAGVRRSIAAARTAEAHLDVMAIDSSIKTLRAAQLAAHDEPTAEEWEAYNVAQAAKE